MAKNNGHQNFTYGLGIPTPSPYLGIIPKKQFLFSCFPYTDQVQYPNCNYNGTGGSSLSGMSSSERRLFNRDFLLKKNLRYTWLWWKDLVNQSFKHLIGQWPSPSAADAARADCKSWYSEETNSYRSIKDHVFHLNADINDENASDQSCHQLSYKSYGMNFAFFSFM